MKKYLNDKYILTKWTIFRKIKNQGYYILNPDKTLTNAEKRMSNFFEERKLDWNGMQSEEPTSEQFISLLKHNNILL